MIPGAEQIYQFIQITAGRCGRPRLLVVDDEEGPRAAVTILFRPEFDVLALNSSELALIACAQRCFDVAVSDNRRAGMSGIECLAHMRKIDPTVPVIMLSAFATREMICRAVKLNAFGVLEKPFDIWELRDAVITALRLRRSGHPLPPLDSRPFPRWWRERLANSSW